MNKFFKQNWTDRIEKYLLILMSTVAGLQLSAMAWLVMALDTQTAVVISGGFVFYAIVVILALATRKILKEQRLGSFSVSKDSISVEFEDSEKGSDINEGFSPSAPMD